MEKIDNIVNGSYTVIEKQKMLEDLKVEFLRKIDYANKKIVEGYKKCPNCNQYYRKNAWENKSVHEKRNVCTFHSPCEFDDDKYEEKMCKIYYSICPVGHIFEDFVDWE